MLKIVLMYCGFAEQMGTQILDDLHSQRSTIQRARDRVCSCWVLYFFQNIEDSDFCYHQFFFCVLCEVKKRMQILQKCCRNCQV